MLKAKPTRVIEWSVKGMLPKGSLGRRLGMKLKVYAGPNHPHQAQKPQALALLRLRRRTAGAVSRCTDA